MRQFAEHTWTLHFISKHHPPSHSVHPLLMSPLMSSLTMFELQAEVQELPLPFGTELWSCACPCLGSVVTSSHVLSHTTSLGGTHTYSGASKCAWDAVPSADPEVSLGPWQLCQGTGEVLEGSLALATAQQRTAQGGRLARRKPNHQTVETGAAEPAVLDKWRENSWQC